MLEEAHASLEGMSFPRTFTVITEQGERGSSKLREEETVENVKRQGSEIPQAEAHVGKG